MTLVRPTSPALDAILGKKFKVLDGGFIRVKDYMGNDAVFTEAAKISYNLDEDKPVKIKRLIRRLLRDRHTSPFEMCELRLHVRMPIYVMRQWIRHRTANVNEYSMRYSEAIDEMERTPPDAWRLQSKDNKQGSSGVITPTTPWPAGYKIERDSFGDGKYSVSYLGREVMRVPNHPTPGEWLSFREGAAQRLAREVYDERLRFGVAREQARSIIPVANYTECHWKIDAHNLLHFLALRMAADAQSEIRQYAQIIGEHIVAAWLPMTWDAFENYRRQSLVFSGVEAKILKMLLEGDCMSLSFGQALKELVEREREEFQTKLRRLGLDYSSQLAA